MEIFTMKCTVPNIKSKSESKKVFFSVQCLESPVFIFSKNIWNLYLIRKVKLNLYC